MGVGLAVIVGAVGLFGMSDREARIGHGTQPVKIGGFEAVKDGTPEGWSQTTWGGRAAFSMDAGKEGRGVVVASTAGADAGWSTIVPVKPFAKYTLSGWIKTENVERKGGRGVVLNVHGNRAHTTPMAGTNGWTRVECAVETGAEDSIQVNCCFGYFGNATGKAWYDGVTLTLVEAREMKSEVVVDAERVREAMSPYIYAQFIEHMGRCIYGGIWAEMLEDRKFFSAVGGSTGGVRSAWTAMGGARVVMQEQDAFSGDHSPRIEGARGAGIVQAGLGVVPGKTYVGSVWADGEVEVRLVWGEGSAERATARCAGGAGFRKGEFRFEVADSRVKPAGLEARLEVVKVGEGPVRVGAVSLMPGDHVKGMRADVLKLLKDLDAPLYRWPGGNFVSGYEWRDGIGDRDRRPTRKNPAWTGIDSNDFGVHEFMAFCAEIGTEPLVVVNTGFGDSYSAAQWVEYMNGNASTVMGAVRAENGRAEPWKIVWWGVGNEMWGDWQLGHMKVDQYAIKHNDFVKRMRKVDPTIKVVGSGDLGGGWSERMLKECAGTMDLLSEHFYCQERPGVAAHVSQMPEAIRAKAEAHREYRKRLPELKGKDIRIAMDEWNYWYGPHVFGELGTRYFLKDALGIAAGLHEYSRCTDVVLMANYAQTVNVIGAIKTDKTRAWMETTGEVLATYRKRFGTIPVEVTGEAGLMDVAAAWSADRAWFTLAVVNPAAEDAGVKVTWKGVVLGEGTMWTMGGKDPQAYNEPDGAEHLKFEEAAAGAPGAEIRVPGYSVRLWRWRVAR